MKLNIVKRVVYGLCGAMSLLTAFAALFAGALVTVVAEALAELDEVEPTEIPIWDDVLTFGVMGALLMVITIGHTKLLAAPAKSKYLFLATAAVVCGRLIMDALNTAQGFHTGHVIMVLVLAALAHDVRALRKRAARLASINWR